MKTSIEQSTRPTVDSAKKINNKNGVAMLTNPNLSPKKTLRIRRREA